MSQKPDPLFASIQEIRHYNLYQRPEWENKMPLPAIAQLPPPPPPIIRPSYPDRPSGPNPIADFFCAPSHTTPWPHNGGYKR